MGFNVGGLGCEKNIIPESNIHTLLDECKKLLDFYIEKYEMRVNPVINYDTYTIRDKNSSNNKLILEFDRATEEITAVFNQLTESQMNRLKSLINNDIVRGTKLIQSKKISEGDVNIFCIDLYSFLNSYNELIKIRHSSFKSGDKTKMRYDYTNIDNAIYEIMKINSTSSKIKLYLHACKILEIIPNKNLDTKSYPSHPKAISTPPDNNETTIKEPNKPIIKSLAFNNGVETLLVEENNTKYIKKILHIPKLVGDEGFKELKRFDTSIKQISKLNIPNTPKFIESGSTDSEIWYSYQYIEGLNLNEYIQKVQLTSNMIEYFIIQLLNIQQNLIKNNIIHRDIKPSNIIVNNNELYLIDFNTIRNSNSGGTTSILSWGYTPINETLLPNNTTDVYSIGVIWYQMLTEINVVEYAINNRELDLNLIKDKKTRYILSNMLCNRGSRWNGEQVLDAIQNGVKTKSKSSMRMISPLSIINSILSGLGLSLGLYLESGVMIIISSLVLVSGIASIISSIVILSDDIYDKLDEIKDIEVENPRTYTKTYRE